eukprot:6473133-Amphidinium_carterae.1
MVSRVSRNGGTLFTQFIADEVATPVIGPESGDTCHCIRRVVTPVIGAELDMRRSTPSAFVWKMCHLIAIAFPLRMLKHCAYQHREKRSSQAEKRGARFFTSITDWQAHYLTTNSNRPHQHMQAQHGGMDWGTARKQPWIQQRSRSVVGEDIGNAHHRRVLTESCQGQPANVTEHNVHTNYETFIAFEEASIPLHSEPAASTWSATQSCTTSTKATADSSSSTPDGHLHHHSHRQQEQPPTTEQPPAENAKHQDSESALSTGEYIEKLKTKYRKLQ